MRTNDHPPYRRGDDARLWLEHNGSPIPAGAYVTLSADPYDTGRGWRVEVEHGSWNQPRFDEVDLECLEVLCAACMDPAPDGIRQASGHWFCNACDLFEREQAS